MKKKNCKMSRGGGSKREFTSIVSIRNPDGLSRCRSVEKKREYRTKGVSLLGLKKGKKALQPSH